MWDFKSTDSITMLVHLYLGAHISQIDPRLAHYSRKPGGDLSPKLEHTSILPPLLLLLLPPQRLLFITIIGKCKSSK